MPKPPSAQSAVVSRRRLRLPLPWAHFHHFALSHPCRMKSYEGKLATMTAINSALQSENEDLRRQVKQAAAPTTATGASQWRRCTDPSLLLFLPTTTPTQPHHHSWPLHHPATLPRAHSHTTPQKPRWQSYRRSLPGAWEQQTAP